MAIINKGRIDWGVSRDGEGHREFTITHLIRTSDKDIGPNAILNDPSLPQVGSVWNFGSDVNVWAWCLPETDVKPKLAGQDDHIRDYIVTNKFSTKPPANSRCSDTQVEDPLSEPPKLSGGFSKYTEEAAFDRFARPILNSAFEQIRGAQVEFDANRGSIKFEYNVPTFEDVLLALNMMDHVNKFPLYGRPARTIKLSNVSWDRKFYGECYTYFSLSLELELSYHFDRYVLDESTKALHGENIDGEWVITPIDDEGTEPDARNPSHFVHYKDQNGENTTCILNGAGIPSGSKVADTSTIYICKEDSTTADIDSDAWIALVGPLLGESYSASKTYRAGSIVKVYVGSLSNNPNADPQDEYEYYIANEDMTGVEPPGGDWFLIERPELKGVHIAGATYTSGNGVYENATVDGVGYILVQKYQESDLLQLGLPLTF